MPADAWGADRKNARRAGRCDELPSSIVLHDQGASLNHRWLATPPHLPTQQASPRCPSLDVPEIECQPESSTARGRISVLEFRIDGMLEWTLRASRLLTISDIAFPILVDHYELSPK